MEQRPDPEDDHGIRATTTTSSRRIRRWVLVFEGLALAVGFQNVANRNTSTPHLTLNPLPLDGPGTPQQRRRHAIRVAGWLSLAAGLIFRFLAVLFRICQASLATREAAASPRIPAVDSHVVNRPRSHGSSRPRAALARSFPAKGRRMGDGRSSSACDVCSAQGPTGPARSHSCRKRTGAAVGSNLQPCLLPAIWFGL